MGMQLVILAKNVEQMRQALSISKSASEIEIFPMNSDHYGLSIPGNVIDALGENVVITILAEFEYFDLYDGVWKGRGSMNKHSLGRRFLSAFKSIF
ncbi:hypothetical protein ABRQ00_12945 [Pectobacterium aroidearum]|uniref:hypothetical protein n=1 Tax=Pectobacterium aroidearum TaxID=1201031 RepID=UPI002FC9FB05